MYAAALPAVLRQLPTNEINNTVNGRLSHRSETLQGNRSNQEVTKHSLPKMKGQLPVM